MPTSHATDLDHTHDPDARCGVPGAEGAGDPTEAPESTTDSWDRWPKSGGAGLLDDMRRGGRSALIWLASLGGLSSWLSVYWPSFVLRE